MDLRAIALAVPFRGGEEDDAAREARCKKRRADAAENARKALAKKRVDAKQQKLEEVSKAASFAVAVLPGADKLLQSSTSTALAPCANPMVASAALAFSPKIRGSGSCIEKCRRLQNRAVALVGKCVVDRQAYGLNRWLEMGLKATESMRVRGVCAMWDEATQKLRALLLDRAQRESLASATLAASKKTAQVMVTLSAVAELALAAELVDGKVERCFFCQPWIAGPLFLPSTKAAFVLDGVLRNLPIKIAERESVEKWGKETEFILIVLCFDGASGNIAALKKMISLVSAFGYIPIAIHAVLCLSHQINLIKSSTVFASGWAGMCYSLSQIMKVGNAVTNLVSSIQEIVKKKLEFRIGLPPDNLDLFNVMLLIFGIDNHSAAFTVDRNGVRRETKFYKELKWMAQCSRFDPFTGKWTYYVVDGVRPSVAEAVGFISAPLVSFFAGRHWKTAALSRWTGVMEVVKKVVLGSVFGNMLPNALGGMSSSMDITEASLKIEIAENAAKAMRG